MSGGNSVSAAVSPFNSKVSLLHQRRKLWPVNLHLAHKAAVSYLIKIIDDAIGNYYVLYSRKFF
jgi:hypothetical protein